MEDCLQRISLHNPPQYISNRSSRTLESCKSYDEKTWPSTCPKEVLFGTKIVNELIKCVSDMDWFSRVNLGTHSHHYSFLASTLKLDSSQQAARWEIVQQRQRNAPRSLSVLDGRPELLKPRDALYKSERERELSKQKELATLWPKYTFISFYEFSSTSLFMYAILASEERRFGTVSNVKTPAVHSITSPFCLQYLPKKCCPCLNFYPKEYNDS